MVPFAKIVISLPQKTSLKENEEEKSKVGEVRKVSEICGRKMRRLCLMLLL